MMMAWMIAATAIIGCGGSGGSNSGSGGSSIPATSAGTYTFQVSGTDSSNSSIMAKANVSVTVQ
jgi:hypothetical protein